jgi:hypothetical protein
MLQTELPAVKERGRTATPQTVIHFDRREWYSPELVEKRGGCAMATLAKSYDVDDRRSDLLSGTPRAGTIDRWIYVFTAASFIVITLTGFIPDSLMKIAAVQAGERPPFPLILHMHAVLMGSFLMFLLAQTTLMATGRGDLHRRLGITAFALAAVLVVVGLILVPTMYHSVWNAAQNAPPETRAKLEKILLRRDNILLLQLRVGFLFPLFLLIGLRARGRNAGLHKRMMILATAVALGASFDRIRWLPTTLPTSILSSDLYILLAVSPMFLWDVVRNRTVHPAYAIWLGVYLTVSLAVYGLWDTASWHSMAPRLMGV